VDDYWKKCEIGEILIRYFEFIFVLLLNWSNNYVVVKNVIVDNELWRDNSVRLLWIGLHCNNWNLVW